MKKLVLIMAIVLMAGTAYAVSYVDTGGNNAQGAGGGPPIEPDLHNLDDYLHQHGMDREGDTGSDPIMEDSWVSGIAWDHPIDDYDDFNFEVGLPFSVTFDTAHDNFTFNQGYGLSGPQLFADHSNRQYPTGIDSWDYPPEIPQAGALDPESVVHPPGEYSVRIMTLNPSWGAPYGPWIFNIDVQEPPIPEPAGLGVVGLALLGLRKRRS